MTTNSAHAQNTQPSTRKNTTSDEFAWGVCLGALAVLGAIVGLTASSAATSPPTYSTAPDPAS